MINFNLLIRQLLNILTVVKNYFKIGIETVMIEIIMVKYKILLNQQKQTVQLSSGATSLPPIGNSFMYIETSSNNHRHERVFVSW